MTPGCDKRCAGGQNCLVGWADGSCGAGPQGVKWPVMTEEQWFSSDDPPAMIRSVQGRVSDRKLRLFACACCRTCWPLLPDERSRRAVEVAERFADGEATGYELYTARVDATRPDGDSCLASTAAWECTMPDATNSAEHVASFDAMPVDKADILRDIVGNPFRPVVPLAGDCLTPLVLSLAQAAYDHRDDNGALEWDRLAVLSDALEEAGCVDAELLTHLRSPGPHVRGCWVLDLILGKE